MPAKKPDPSAKLSRGKRRFTGHFGRPALTFVVALSMTAVAAGGYGVSAASASATSKLVASHVKSTKPYSLTSTWTAVGDTPHFTAVDYALGRVFVSNLTEGTLSVLNLQGVLIDNIKLGGVVHTVEVDQATGMVYATDIVRGYLDVVNASSYKVVAQIPVAAHLHGLAVSNSLHLAIVTDVAQSKIYLINTVTNHVITTKGIGVGVNPWGVAIDAARKLAYVANTGIDPFAQPSALAVNPKGDSVSVVSLATDKVISTIPVGPHPWNLAITQTGVVYVGVQGGNEVAVIQDGRVASDISVGTSPHGVAYDPVRKMIFVNNSVSNTASVISTRSNTVIQTIPVGSQPQGISVDVLTGDAYVANQATASISVISPN